MEKLKELEEKVLILRECPSYPHYLKALEELENYKKEINKK